MDRSEFFQVWSTEASRVDWRIKGRIKTAEIGLGSGPWRSYISQPVSVGRLHTGSGKTALEKKRRTEFFPEVGSKIHADTERLLQGNQTLWYPVDLIYAQDHADAVE